MAAKLPIIWTNDDIYTGCAVHLKRQLDFIDRFGIPGVFFVIPCAYPGKRGIDTDKELLQLIEEARGNGHEFYQHGYIHQAFECGISPMNVYPYDLEAKRLFDTDRDFLESLHTLEAQVEMLENSQRIWAPATLFMKNS